MKWKGFVDCEGIREMALYRLPIVALDDATELLFAVDGAMGLWFKRLSSRQIIFGRVPQRQTVGRSSPMDRSAAGFRRPASEERAFAHPFSDAL